MKIIKQQLDKVKQKYLPFMDHLFFTFENDSVIYVGALVVKHEFRSQGIGSKVLLEINKIADQFGLDVAVHPSNCYGGDLDRLLEFYPRFGFKSSFDRKYNYCGMVRKFVG